MWFEQFEEHVIYLSTDEASCAVAAEVPTAITKKTIKNFNIFFVCRR